jgi:hypothetical protein
MPTTNTADELSLINDAEFLQELEQFPLGNAADHSRSSTRPRPEYPDVFAALDHGLEVEETGAFPDAAQAEHANRDSGDGFAVADVRSRTDSRIPMMTAALVLLACLAAGAATAVLVFGDRVDRITAVWPASR